MSIGKYIHISDFPPHQPEFKETVEDLSVIEGVVSKKMRWKNSSKNQKYAHIGTHIPCKVAICDCKGYVYSHLLEDPSDCVNISLHSLCIPCGHTLMCHVSHLHNQTDDFINNQLETGIDLDTMVKWLNKESNEENKKLINIVIKILKSQMKIALYDMKKELGILPFESPTIVEILKNFVSYKYRDLPEEKFQAANFTSKQFIFYIKMIHLDEPNVWQEKNPNSDSDYYKKTYSRWFCICFIPFIYCESLPHKETGAMFGRKFFEMLFLFYKGRILENIQKPEEDVCPKVVDCFPRFFSDLEEEMQKENSSVWNLEPSTKNPDILPNGFSKCINCEQGESWENCVFKSIEEFEDKLGSVTCVNAEDDVSAVEDQKASIPYHIIANSISNPPDRQCKIWLIQIQNIFASQLPEMSRSYVTQLVFDPKHKNLVLLEGNEVIGGICFRMFPSQHLCEVVFCAVSLHNQVKGVGTGLMQHLKDYVLKSNIMILLTYADIFAVGYFKKQGFTMDVVLPKEIYSGYIKTYEGGILMECRLNPDFRYTQISSALSIQKEIISTILRERYGSADKFYSGLNHFREGYQGNPSTKEPRAYDINEKYGNGVPQNAKILCEKLKVILIRIKNHSCAEPFLELVDPEKEPEYFK